MADAFVQVAPDSTGKKIQTFENTVSGNLVEAQAVVLVDSSGNPIDVVEKATGPTPTTLNEVIALLQAAGLCS